MRNDTARARLALVASMCMFGTIGLLRRALPVPSGFLAMLRGLLGSLSLLLWVLLRGGRLSREAIRANFPRLLLSGVLNGFNWILMFEAYRHTTIAAATLCYYMAPVFTLAAAPLVLRERLTPRKALCLVAALLGMVFVSGVARTGFSGAGEWRGAALALAAAVLYAMVVLMKKRMRGIGAYDRTIVQIGIAGAVLIPYTALTENLAAVVFTPAVIVLLLVAGLIHTGLAYALYFSSVDFLPAHSLALMSYLDPVVAVLLSALVLREPMTFSDILGAVLILCAAIIAELPEHPQHSQEESL